MKGVNDRVERYSYGLVRDDKDSCFHNRPTLVTFYIPRGIEYMIVISATTFQEYHPCETTMLKHTFLVKYG